VPAQNPERPSIPDYALIRKIGSGGYGDVWLARGLTGVYRAVKIVWRDRFADAAPFEREFNGLKNFMAMTLPEAGQLALLHAGRNEAAGFFYYVMELADDVRTGRDVDPATYVPLTLRELRVRRGRLPAAETVKIGIELARALAGLHARGLVHRDIKPSNIILVGGGPKLADIGLVAATAEAVTFVGTAGFVPPEGPGRPAADVFALGRLLYELATGLDRDDYPRLPPELNAAPDRALLMELNAIILRACEPNPAQRHRDGAAVLADLLAVQAGRTRRGRRRRGFAALAAAAVGAAVLAGLVFKVVRHAPAAPPPAASETATAVAVLPFANLSGDREQEYFSDGLTEEILNALARERELRVPGRTSSFSFKGKNLAAPEIARALGVTRLVEGSVQRVGSRVRIRVQLTRAADGFTENLGTFDRELPDIFALQDEVARVVVERLTRRPAPGMVAVLTANPGAYDAYLRGRALQTRGFDQMGEAVRAFEEAVGLDPKFALAWARLAEARFRPFAAGVDRSPALVEAARAAVARALGLQPDLPEGLIVRSNLARLADRDTAAAERDLARAELRQPSLPEIPLLRHAIARDAGHWPEAFRQARACVRLDPQNGDNLNALGLAFLFAGEFAEADRLFAKAAAIQGPQAAPPFANRVATRWRWRGAEAALRLARQASPEQAGAPVLQMELLAALGRTGDVGALAEAMDRAQPGGAVEAIMQGERDPVSVLRVRGLLGRDDPFRAAAERVRAGIQRQVGRGNRAPNVRLHFVKAELLLGHAESAAAELAALRRETGEQDPGPFRANYEFRRWAPAFYVALGRKDDALAVLSESQAAGFQPGHSLRTDPSLAALRDDPRFQELTKQAEAWADAQPAPADETAH
jgi:TolB-like protein